jgi:Zn-finger nucleic acid-binding protein
MAFRLDKGLRKRGWSEDGTVNILARMEAQTLHCPDCGAPASSDATKCEHCGARLATIACPSCFGMIFLGSKFCPHCGARVSRTEDEEAAGKKHCPRCNTGLRPVTLGTMAMEECSQCEGLWVGVDAFNDICADRDKQAAVLGGASPNPTALDPTVEEVRYLHCPECSTLMNRVNFAGRSGIIIDVCRGHGTWFDQDELRHVVEFIRAGGLEQARQREIERLEEARRQRMPVGSIEPLASGSGDSIDDDWHSGWAVADFLAFVGGALARLLFK